MLHGSCWLSGLRSQVSGSFHSFVRTSPGVGAGSTRPRAGTLSGSACTTEWLGRAPSPRSPCCDDLRQPVGHRIQRQRGSFGLPPPLVRYGLMIPSPKVPRQVRLVGSGAPTTTSASGPLRCASTCQAGSTGLVTAGLGRAQWVGLELRRTGRTRRAEHRSAEHPSAGRCSWRVSGRTLRRLNIPSSAGRLPKRLRSRQGRVRSSLRSGTPGTRASLRSPLTAGAAHQHVTWLRSGHRRAQTVPSATPPNERHPHDSPVAPWSYCTCNRQ